jgi:hypothetical protein
MKAKAIKPRPEPFPESSKGRTRLGSDNLLGALCVLCGSIISLDGMTLKSMTGRVAATVMMAKTNIGSVKLTLSTYSMAGPVPIRTVMHVIKMPAQSPKMISTSPTR